MEDFKEQPKTTDDQCKLDKDEKEVQKVKQAKEELKEAIEALEQFIRECALSSQSQNSEDKSMSEDENLEKLITIGKWLSVNHSRLKNDQKKLDDEILRQVEKDFKEKQKRFSAALCNLQRRKSNVIGPRLVFIEKWMKSREDDKKCYKKIIPDLKNVIKFLNGKKFSQRNTQDSETNDMSENMLSNATRNQILEQIKSLSQRITTHQSERKVNAKRGLECGWLSGKTSDGKGALYFEMTFRSICEQSSGITKEETQNYWKKYEANKKKRKQKEEQTQKNIALIDKWLNEQKAKRQLYNEAMSKLHTLGCLEQNAKVETTNQLPGWCVVS